jgi:peptide deformylase
MFSVMFDNKGLGLAAPQVGKSLRVIVVDVPPNFSGVMVNPEICSFSTIEEVGREGCLSFPGIYLDIKRSSSIFVKYQDLRGQLHQLSTDGLLARCIIHEIDHLNGEVFIDKEYIRN